MKSIKNFQLVENNLFTDNVSRDTLMQNKELLMNSVMFNYFGFLGLFALSDLRGMLKTYETSEGELTIGGVSDKNHDVSLSVKMATDAGLIPPSVATKMLNVLIGIKTGKILKSTLDLEFVRKLLDEIHYSVHKPSTKVYSVVRDFHDSKIDLGDLAYNLYQLAKFAEHKPITVEFRDLFLRGQYYQLVQQKIALDAVKKPVASISVATSTTPLVQDELFFKRILKPKTLTELNTLLNNTGLDLTTMLDEIKFEKYLIANAGEIKISNVLIEIINRLNSRKTKLGFEILNKLVVKQCNLLLKLRDLDRFIEKLNEPLVQNLIKQYRSSSRGDYNALMLQASNEWYSRVQSLEKQGIKRKIKQLSELLSELQILSVLMNVVDPVNAIFKMPESELNVSISASFILGLFNWYDINQVINDSFSVDNIVACPFKGSVKINKSCYDAASEDKKLAYDLLIAYEYKEAEVVDLSHDNNFYELLYVAKNDFDVESVLEEYGTWYSNINTKEFTNWVNRNLQSFPIPEFNIFKKILGSTDSNKLYMEIVLQNSLVQLRHRDLQELVNLLHSNDDIIQAMKLDKAFNKQFKEDVILPFLQIVYSDIKDTGINETGYPAKLETDVVNLLTLCNEVLLNKTLVVPELFGEKLSIQNALAMISGMNYSNFSSLPVGSFINNSFGEGASIDKSSWKLKTSFFDSANKPLQIAYSLLVSNNIGDSELINDDLSENVIFNLDNNIKRLVSFNDFIEQLDRF